MELTDLVREMTAFLTPLLPYLFKTSKEPGNEMAKKIGEDMWKEAEVLWNKLRPEVEIKPSAQEAVNDALRAPSDEDAQAALRVQLKKILIENKALAVEVEQLWQETKTARSISSGNHSVTIDDNTTVTGDESLMQRGKYNINIARATGTAIGDDTYADAKPNKKDD